MGRCIATDVRKKRVPALLKKRPAALRGHSQSREGWEEKRNPWPEVGARGFILLKTWDRQTIERCL